MLATNMAEGAGLFRLTILDDLATINRRLRTVLDSIETLCLTAIDQRLRNTLLGT